MQRPQDAEQQKDHYSEKKNDIRGNIRQVAPVKSGSNVRLPHKKTRGKELTEEQKQENREFSAQRVKWEHAHAGMKRYNSVTAVYRNRVPADR